MQFSSLLFYSARACALLIGLCISVTSFFGQGSAGSNADFSGFAPAGMAGASVDKLSGQFQFGLPIMTIPGAQGEGYALTLGYSVPTPGSEASWVGFGWSLSPGAISRQLNGIPDDFNGREIININKHPDYRSITVYPKNGVEVKGKDVDITAGLKVGVSLDGYRGLLPAVNANLDGYGLGVNYSMTGYSGGFSFSVNPLTTFLKLKNAVSSEKPAPQEDDFATKKEFRAALEEYNKKQHRKSVMNSYRDQLLGQTIPLTPLRGMPSYPNNTRVTQVALGGSFQRDNGQGSNLGPEIGFSATYYEQDEVPIDCRKVFGYIHSYADGIDENSGMDFTEELSGPLDVLDQFMPIPVATPDRYSVSAQGLSGTFRAHHSVPVRFRDIALRYEKPVSVGVEVEGTLGPLTPPTVPFTSSLALGVDLTVNSPLVVTSRTWEVSDAANAAGQLTFDPLALGGEELESEVFFSFEGDLARHRTYGSAGGDVRRAVPKKRFGSETIFGDLTDKDNGLIFSPPIGDQVHPYVRPAQTKWVRANKRSQRFDPSYDFDCVPPAFVDELNEDDARKDEVDEFQIVNEDGVIYTFGQPVMVRNTGSLSFLDYDAIPKPGDPPLWQGDELHDQKVWVDDDYLAMPNIDDMVSSGDWGALGDALEPFDWVQGRIIPGRYASEYLLTSIASPDYVDNDGVPGFSPGDDGTYVTFSYTRLYGGAEEDAEWLNYRQPFHGAYYSQGMSADPWDDRFSVSFGQKEVFQLDTVATKSHYACFSTSNRQDQREPSGVWANRGEPSHDGHLKKLDKIQLFKRLDAGDELIQTVSFETDYSLMVGVPDNETSGGGRLTLKEVQFQNGGIVDVVDRFGFAYEYFSPTASGLDGIPSSYDAFFAEYDGLDENPSFSFNATNAWGQQRADSLGRTDEFHLQHGWEDRIRKPAPGHDPAAYALKQIELPSGALILPQYEEGSYTYVQDQRAMEMVPVTDASDMTKFYPKWEDAGWEVEQDELVASLRDHFGLDGDGPASPRLYFKTRFDFSDDADGHHHFTGFARVEDVGADESGVFIQLENDGPLSLPQRVCRDYYRKNPRVSQDEGWGLAALMLSPEVDPASVALDAVDGYFRLMAAPISIPYSMSSAVLEEMAGCPNYAVEESYVRLPLPPGHSKKGGPPRVKRLLQLDRGIEDGDEMLFGKRYLYDTKEGGKRESSGHAANEPGGIYEACPLFAPIDRKQQSALRRVFAGRDLERMTGPIGSSFLPGPSILYSEVVEKSIHSGRSAEGFVISKYLTHRDHPMRVRHTDVDDVILFRKAPPPLGLGGEVDGFAIGASVNYKELFASQGYEFELSSLPGMPEEVLAVDGDHAIPDSWSLASRSLYEYFGQEEDVPLMSKWDMKSGRPGHFEEVYFLGRRLRTESYGNNTIAGDAGLLIGAAPPYLGLDGITIRPSGVNLAISSENQGTHVTTTVVRRPAKLKNVTVIGGGKESTVTTTAYDELTGMSVRTEAKTGFSDVDLSAFDLSGDRLISQNLPGHMWHQNLAGAYINDRKHLVSKTGELKGIQMNLGVTACGENTTTVPEGWTVVFRTYGDPGESEVTPSGGESTTIASPESFYIELLPENGQLLFDDQSGWRAMDNFQEGDIVDIRFSGGHSHSLARVSRVEGNRAYLGHHYRHRIDFSDVVGQIDETLYPGRVIDNIEVVVLQSGRKNQFGKGMGALVIHDDDVHVDKEPRLPDGLTDLLNQMDDSLKTGTDQVPYSESRTLSGSAIEAATGMSSVAVHFHIASAGRGFISFDAPLSPCTPLPNLKDPTSSGSVIPIHLAQGGTAGEFDFDEESGAIVWRSAANPHFPVVVIQPEEDWSDWIHVDNVVTASANDLTDELPYEERSADISDPFFTGERGRWGSTQNWLYDSPATSFENHSAKAGLMTDFHALNPSREDQSVYESWIPVSRMNSFDDQLRVLEMEDALSNASAQQFGPDQMMLWSARNATYGSCAFESCENRDINGDLVGVQWTGGELVDDDGHSGRRCIKFSTNQLNGPEIEVDTVMYQTGGRLRFWAHLGEQEAPSFTLKMKLDGGGTGSEQDAHELASTGRWRLYEVNIPPDSDAFPGFSIGNKYRPQLFGASGVLVDDLKFQPVRSLMTCNVYDERYRLIAAFGENHFGQFPQYNQRGEYVRNRVETLDGLKTVSEQHLNRKLTQ